MSEVITASPNEAESIRLEEFRRSRLQRLLQVRDAERQRSKSIRSNAEEQVALAKGDLKAKVTREVAMEFRQAMQHTRQRLRSAETSVGESFAAAPNPLLLLPVSSALDDICLAFHPHSLVARMAAATVECIPLLQRGSSLIPSNPKASEMRQLKHKTRSPISAFVGPSPSTRISGRRSSVRPVDLATQRATFEGMKGKKVHSTLKGQLMQDIVGSVLTEIKLQRGSTSLFNKVRARASHRAGAALHC